MLSRAQQILLKRAQREAGLQDDEYRDALEIVTGCRSSTDRDFTDRHLDLCLSYFEAIFWRKVDAGELQALCGVTAIFRQRGYWASKNTKNETSRDRWSGRKLGEEIAGIESQLFDLGFTRNYCDSIRTNVVQDRRDAHADHVYLAALRRTLGSKQKHSPNHNLL